jgi:hypothetical protein
MSRRQRQRAQARPWQSKPDQETPIPWEAIAAERQRREQQLQQPKG